MYVRGGPKQRRGSIEPKLFSIKKCSLAETARFKRAVSRHFQQYIDHPRFDQDCTQLTPVNLTALQFAAMARGRIAFTIQEKQKIVQQAYSVPGNVKATARLFKIQPNQIRDWKRNLSLETEKLDLRRRVPDQTNNLERTDIWSHLLQSYNQWRNQDIAVSITMLCQEVRRWFSFQFLICNSINKRFQI